jgi:isoquinoline 1-oxidoreductase subunit alpha
MQLRINGRTYDVSDDYAQEPLLWALRDGLGLTGTKYGCGAGICGACTVRLDGVATRACLVPTSAAASVEITTIEGLASEDGTLHPVQQAFVEQQVPQCAWCMSGQVMAAAALLDANPEPSEQEIVAAMRNNYCRCGCYARIKSAVALAAERKRGQSA